LHEFDEKEKRAFANESRLFHTYFNDKLKTKLGNKRKKDSEKETDSRIKGVVDAVSNYLENNCPEVALTAPGAGEMINPSQIIQKLIYEPPTEPNGDDHTFTVVHQDGSKKNWVTLEYLEYYLGPLTVECALHTAKRIHKINGTQFSFTVPSGDSNADVAPASCLAKTTKTGRQRKIRYPQGETEHCFMNSFASALHYLGKFEESRIVANKAKSISSMGLVDQLKHLVDMVTKKMPGISNKSKGCNLKDSSMVELLEAGRKEDLMIVVPKGNALATTHAVAICDGLIFDSTQEFPLELTEDSLNFVCGSTGFEKTYMSRSFTVV
jgi:primase-polymerase (primpol)-like protein